MSEPALSRGEEVNLLAWILKRSQTHDVGRYLGLKRYPKGWNYARLLSLFPTLQSYRGYQMVP